MKKINSYKLDVKKLEKWRKVVKRVIGFIRTMKRGLVKKVHLHN